MKKAIRNFIIGAAMAASVFGTAGAAFAQSTAATQYVQNSMNFRSGASLSGTIIGSVPAGAKVDVLAYAGDWVQVRNHIHNRSCILNGIRKHDPSAVHGQYLDQPGAEPEFQYRGMEERESIFRIPGSEKPAHL